MTLIVPFFSETAGWVVTIDGRDYRPALIDSSGRVIAALDLTGIVALTTIANGQKTVTNHGTAEQLPSAACVAATIKALPGNSGNIYLGDSGVDSSNGHVLAPGDAFNVAIDNLNRFYIDADNDGEGVSYLVVS
ncbi:MAG: hypothetical protein E3J29_01935 [Dehalococcoidia bacterium]|nr:MAG: hypothetical protein E3J29_01935 [Dehalococcoidia bacterium]